MSIAGVAGVGFAFKWWYDYNKGVKEATKLTKQFTDKSGDDLKIYRSEVQALADYYSKDFRDMLTAINSVEKQFGISSDEALKVIKDGFIAGADAKGEFLSALKEYPAYFKEAGISADQFVAIIAETNKQGVFSDKGIDTIKEANTRLREMTTSTAGALDGIGISSKQVQKDLQTGAKTTQQINRQVINVAPQQTDVNTQVPQSQTQTRYIQSQNTEPQRQRIKTIPKQTSKPSTANNDEMSDLEMLSQILKGVQEQTKPAPKQNSNYKNPYMTEQEEIIAWSKWRSDLQNRIMEDSNAEYAPYGTIFLFTFIVDKYGNISNVKVQCSNPNYMDIARNGVKPAITNLQKKPILNFPRGSQRTSTVVTGSFILGSQNVYSNPNDY